MTKTSLETVTYLTSCPSCPPTWKYPCPREVIEKEMVKGGQGKQPEFVHVASNHASLPLAHIDVGALHALSPTCCLYFSLNTSGFNRLISHPSYVCQHGLRGIMGIFCVLTTSCLEDLSRQMRGKDRQRMCLSVEHIFCKNGRSAR